MKENLLNEMKKDNSTDLPDEVSVGLFRRLEKQRGESIEAFEQAGQLAPGNAEVQRLLDAASRLSRSTPRRR